MKKISASAEVAFAGDQNQNSLHIFHNENRKKIYTGVSDKSVSIKEFDEWCSILENLIPEGQHTSNTSVISV